MAEWLKAAVLKTVSGVTRSGVRIPLPPPVQSVADTISASWISDASSTYIALILGIHLLELRF